MKIFNHQQNSCFKRDFPPSLRILFLLILSGFPILSCLSDGNILKDDIPHSFSLMAKVFNGKNRSCPGVLVTLENNRGRIYEARTDITGKALFPPLPFDSYQVVLQKKGYEKVEFSFSYNRPDQALYGRLYSFEYLLDQCLYHMEKQEWEWSRGWLERAVLLNENEQLCLFHEAIILWKTGSPRQAAAILEENRAKKGPLPPEMAQFLKDLYYYDLKEESSEKTD